jgi:hypothetical protein
MEIRKDFASIAQELERLLQFQKVFQENNIILCIQLLGAYFLPRST